MRWRRSYDIPPPALSEAAALVAARDARYRNVLPDLLPRTECLADVLVRVMPYWADAIVSQLRCGRLVLVSAHGNSLRALVKHLDWIDDVAIAELNLPTGIPLLSELDDALRPLRPVAPPFDVSGRYLDPAGAARSIDAVRSQGRAATHSA